MSRSKAAEESAPRVPIWIITFSDMTTNLLTFFVLLLSMGHVRDETLFDQGEYMSLLFLDSVKAGFGFTDVTSFDYSKIKYRIDQPEQPQGITKNAQEERTRRLFQTLRQSMSTMPSQLNGVRAEFTVAGVQFEPGQALLDEAGGQWLSRFCLNVQHNLDPATTLLYVVGVPGNEAGEAQPQLLAASRSRAVATFLRQTLSASTAGPGDGILDGGGSLWRVFWWGAGPGASWAGQDLPNSGQSQILIAAMKTGR